MRHQQLSLDELKKTDIVEYLNQLGYRPAKIVYADYWFLSPFRTEKEPSFKVNKIKNCWYDFGEGVGGNLVDFCLRYYECSIKDLFNQVQFQHIHSSVSSHNTTLSDNKASNIQIVRKGDITHLALLNYLETRRIPQHVAKKYCSEVHYALYNKTFFAIGFRNNYGGYELRNKYFKGSSSPKGPTSIDNNSGTVKVFEGFFSFLSYATFNQQEVKNLTNYLVLNSLSFYKNQKDCLDTYDEIRLYLDRDPAGAKATATMTSWSNKYIDCSEVYDGYKDFNDWLLNYPAPDAFQSLAPG